jgi:uncharacterized membrane protein YdjX (TVP38/TMEM64 family)
MTRALPEPDRPSWRSAWTRALALILFVLALALVATVDAVHAAVSDLLAAAAAIIEAHPVLGTTLFVIFSAISAMLAFVSSAVLVPVAVYTWGEPLSMLLLWVGWILGGMSAYAVGRVLGRPVVASLASDAALNRYERQVSAHAPFGLVLLFQIALPSELPGYLLGLVRYDFARYLLALAIAEAPYAVVTVYLGATFLERRPAILISVGAGVLAFSAIAFLLLRKRLSARSGHNNPAYEDQGSGRAGAREQTEPPVTRAR